MNAGEQQWMRDAAKYIAETFEVLSIEPSRARRIEAGEILSILAAHAPAAPQRDMDWLVSVYAHSDSPYTHWSVSIWQEGLPSAVLGPFTAHGLADEAAQKWRAALASSGDAPRAEGLKHTVNGDEHNGWYCYQCNFFSRNVAEAAAHDGLRSPKRPKCGGTNVEPKPDQANCRDLWCRDCREYYKVERRESKIHGAAAPSPPAGTPPEREQVIVECARRLAMPEYDDLFKSGDAHRTAVVVLLNMRRAIQPRPSAEKEGK